MNPIASMDKFFVSGKPMGKGRPRFTKDGHAYTPKTTRDYEEYVRACFMTSRRTNFGDLPVMVKIRAAFPIPQSFSQKKTAEALDDQIRPTKKPDADNIVKAMCDALNKLAYNDDSNVVKLLTDKIYSEDPGVKVWIGMWSKYRDFNDPEWRAE